MNIARLRKTRGFTLIELIVVIVIMGILVAIGAFAYNAIIKSSRADAVSKVAAQVAKTIQADSAAGSKAYAANFQTVEKVEAAVAGDLDGDHEISAASATGFTVTNTTNGCSASVTFGTGVGGANTVGEGTCA